VRTAFIFRTTRWARGKGGVLLGTEREGEGCERVGMKVLTARLAKSSGRWGIGLSVSGYC